MRWRQVWTVFAKELRDMLRDRRTLVVMIGVPVLVYPLLAVGVSQLVAFQMAQIARDKTRLVILDAGAPRLLDPVRADFRIATVEAADQDAAEALLKNSRADAVVIVTPPRPGTPTHQVEVLYTIAEDRSHLAKMRLIDMLRRMTLRGANQELKKVGMSFRKVSPMVLSIRNVQPELRGAFVFGRMMALLLVLLAVTFPFHPALDLAAGEKERGTLETLLVSPAGRREIVLGKYMTVISVGLLGALLNLAAMAVTFGYFAGMTKQVAMFGHEIDSKINDANIKLGDTFFFDAPEAAPSYDFTIGLVAIGKILLALIPLVALFSAVALMLSYMARSYKEGQQYLTPLLVLVMPMTFVAMIPDLHLTTMGALIPVSNVVLLVKDLFVDRLQLVPFVVTLVSTGLLAVLALLIAVRLTERESVLFRDTGTSKMRLRPRREQPTPGVFGAFLAFAVAMFPVALVAPRVLFGLLPKQGVLIAFASSCSVALGGAAAVALLFTWWSRASWRRTLPLRWPGATRVGGGLLLGGGGGVLALLLMALMLKRLPGLADQLKQMAEIARLLGELPVGWQLLLIAVAPAVCEELLFRGLIQSSLVRAWGPVAGIGTAALLFGLAHMHPLKLVPTIGIGLLAGWAAYRHRSLLPAMAIHVAWNATGVLIGWWATGRMDADAGGQVAMPGWAPLVGLALVAAGLWLLARTDPRADAATVD